MIQIIEDKIKQLEAKLKELPKDKIEILELNAKLDLEQLNAVLNKNSINSLNGNLELSQYFYNKFKQFNSLNLANRIILISIMPSILTA